MRSGLLMLCLLMAPVAVLAGEADVTGVKASDRQRGAPSAHLLDHRGQAEERCGLNLGFAGRRLGERGDVVCAPLGLDACAEFCGGGEAHKATSSAGALTTA